MKSRHIQFIALGGTIGTGLFLGIGSAFTLAGPLSVLLGYTFTGLAVFAMMQSLGEMATWLPLPGSIPQFAARYVDDALGFAVGWNVSIFKPFFIHETKTNTLDRTGMRLLSLFVPKFLPPPLSLDFGIPKERSVLQSGSRSSSCS